MELGVTKIISKLKGVSTMRERTRFLETVFGGRNLTGVPLTAGKTGEEKAAEHGTWLPWFSLWVASCLLTPVLG